MAKIITPVAGLVVFWQPIVTLARLKRCVAGRQQTESLRIYACLSPAAYAQHLDAAFAAPVAAIRAGHIPLIDSMDMAFGIQQDLAAPA